MAEWFFRKGSNGEVDRDPAVHALVKDKDFSKIANLWTDGAE